MLIILLVALLGVTSVRCQNNSVEEYELQNNCNCVNYYLCDNDNYIIKSGLNLLDVRISDPIERKLCPTENIQFCCKHREATEEPPITTSTTTPEVSSSTENILIPETTSERHVSVIKVKKNVTCGIQRPTINIRISNPDFSATIAGEFPWMAAIYKRDKFFCSGSLIHSKVVLTVAHYVQRSDASILKVVVSGGTELEKGNPNDERLVSEVIRHPEFYSGGLYNDIALLILDNPLNISQYASPINKICLATPNQDFTKTTCLVAGWNKKELTPLKKVDLPVVGHDECQDNLRRYTNLGPKFELHDSFICAGGVEGRDACLGDGGSPLMCPMDDAYYQVGIVSWGRGCSKENVPGMYTDVGKFSNWIEEELKKRKINIHET